ncbi:MAG TPA: hypothetical protein VG714_03440 [Acidobacteriaceae bacterium]|nr:hypothetical protein [Acidobacteriaceae bacterium]
MIGRLACAVAVMFVAMPMAAHATSAEKIRNGKVAVTDETLQPGEGDSIAGGRATLIVYMSDGAMLYGRMGTRRAVHQVHAGEVMAFSGTMSAVRNVGKAPLHFARVEFLTEGKHETWGKTGLAPNYKVLHEDRYGRTYDIRIKAGEFEPQHTHHDRVVIALSGAKLEHILPDGTKQPSTLETGEIVYRPGATHVGHNLGKTDLWVIAVEPK